MTSKGRKASRALVPRTSLALVTTQTEAGVCWLNSLTEPEFRDRILVDLFRSMQKEGKLDWFENIHGRYDKGVDLLVDLRTDLGPRLLGVQAKSKPITRTGGPGSLSAIQIKAECDAAMAHEFDTPRGPVRLDNIEVWSSAHVTEDAEKEFNPAGAQHKIQVKKPREVFSLIEKFCSNLVRKIPSCALAQYLTQKREPESKTIRLLGCPLNPKRHFLEPSFSRKPLMSFDRMKRENRQLKVRSEAIGIGTIIGGERHGIVFSPALSGRTYLLEHAQSLIADGLGLPLMVNGDKLKGTPPRSMMIWCAQQLGFCTPRELEDLTGQSRLFLLLDDLDNADSTWLASLWALDTSKVKVLATARTLVVPPQVDTFYLEGVDFGSIIKFIRSLDEATSDTGSCVDRVRSFLLRTLDASGLPRTPFIVSAMLEECVASGRSLATPTMGRLIARFVDAQLGSHADNINRVDFETKRDFLTELAGRKQTSFTSSELRRFLAQFIASKAHSHTVDDLYADLLGSAVFTREGDCVFWSHPVIKQYFWVKAMVEGRKLAPLQKILHARMDTTLAALIGSELKNAGSIMGPLLQDLGKLRLPAPSKVIAELSDLGPFQDVLTDEDEEKLIASLEGRDGDSTNEPHPLAELARSGLRSRERNESQLPAKVAREALDDETRRALRKRMEPIIQAMAESKAHIAYNLAALLVNARGTSAEVKEASVRAILVSNMRLGAFVHDFLEVILPQNKTIEFAIGWMRVFLQLQLTDDLIGDPFLMTVFRRLWRTAANDDERIMLLDLRLCCGEANHSQVLACLRELKRWDLLVALYIRAASLYFFRHHQPVERVALRNLLRELRRIPKLDLPRVA